MSNKKNSGQRKQDLQNIKDKDELRKLVGEHVAKWLSEGNEIKKIDSGQSMNGSSPPTFSGNSLWTRETRDI